MKKDKKELLDLGSKNEDKQNFKAPKNLIDNNPYSITSKSLTTTRRTQKAVNDVETKAYADEHRGEYIMYWILLVFFVIVGVLLAKSGVEYLFGRYITNHYIITIIGFVSFGLIYIAEILNISKSWIRRSKAIEIGALRIAMIFIISAMNISFVFLGVYQMSSTEIDENTTEISDNILNDSLSIAYEYDNEINRYLTLIKEIKANSENQWKSVMTSQDKTMIDDYNKVILELRASKGFKLSELYLNKDEQIITSTAETKDWFWLKLILSFLVEILIILFIIATTNYKIGIWEEFKSQENDLIKEANSMISRNMMKNIDQAEKFFGNYNMNLPNEIRTLLEQIEINYDAKTNKKEDNTQFTNGSRVGEWTEDIDFTDILNPKSDTSKN